MTTGGDLVSGGESSHDDDDVAPVFWAKTQRHGGSDFLPLLTHSMDVSAVAARLWDEILSPRQHRWLAAGFGIDESDARTLVRFLAAAHDIGKATPAFQRLAPELAKRLIDPLGWNDGRPSPERHDTLSGAILLKAFEGRDVDKATAEALAASIAGHHGEFRTTKHLRQAFRLTVGQSPDWRPSQQALLDELVARTDFDFGLVDSLVEPSTATVLALAGLISVADWIGSDDRRFPVEIRGADSSSAFVGESFDATAWSLPTIGHSGASFGEVFAGPSDGPVREPRASQQAVIDLLEGAVAEPRLLVIEDRTGSGKTEAALWAVRHELLNGARGFYVGLPTKATAGQFHRRAAVFMSGLWPGVGLAPRLLHSTADLEIEPRPTVNDGAGEDAAIAAADAEAWFSGRRRGLLAGAGVGTVDQLLLSTLRGKHHFVRLWGLQGKVVVVDEAHAYDSYTGALLARTIEWLAALDCSVVVLSATLPEATRRELAGAYRRGLSGGGGPATRAASDPYSAASNDDGIEWSATYPRLLSVTEQATTVQSIEDPREPRRWKVLHQAVSADADEIELARIVAASIEDGGCAAVVCNTVDRAQARYRALTATLPSHVEVVLLHSRMRAMEREPVEQDLFRALGPPSDPLVERPHAMVVVATQIIEQSLDLDFDVMYSDLAPVDLLVQRAGRLHRHERSESRPAGCSTARFVVVDTEGTSAIRPHLRSSDQIYAPAVLHRTRVVLRGRTEIEEPRDLDHLIEGLYAADLPSGAVPDELDPMNAADDLARAATKEHVKNAHAVALAAPRGTPPWKDDLATLADAEGFVVGRYVASTRWADRPSRSFVLLAGDELPGAQRTNPDRSDVIELMRRSFSATSSALVKPLLDQYWADVEASRPPVSFQPPAWQHIGHLRDMTLIELDADGAALPLVRGDHRVSIPLLYHHKEGVVLDRLDHSA